MYEITTRLNEQGYEFWEVAVDEHNVLTYAIEDDAYQMQKQLRRGAYLDVNSGRELEMEDYFVKSIREAYEDSCFDIDSFEHFAASLLISRSEEYGVEGRDFRRTFNAIKHLIDLD